MRALVSNANISLFIADVIYNSSAVGISQSLTSAAVCNYSFSNV